MFKNKILIYISVLSFIAIAIITTAIYTFSKFNSASYSNEVSTPLEHQQIEEIKEMLTQILDQQDPKASLDYMRDQLLVDTSIARECHPILHHLGQSAYEKYRNFEATVGYQDGLCNSGYTHGAIEAHFKASEDIQSTLKTTCSAEDNAATFQQWQCYHGIGHGVMYFTGKDLPRSLALCESLPTDFARGSCSNGAFMERFIIVSHSGSAMSNTSDVNIDLCRQQSVNHKPDCYFYAPTSYLERNTNDYSGAFEDCKSAEKIFISTCIGGVGSQSMKENITKPDIAVDVCRSAPNDYISSCIEGSINLLINHYGSTTHVDALCSRAFYEYNSTCNKVTKSWNSTYAL